MTPAQRESEKENGNGKERLEYGGFSFAVEAFSCG
jgi:hypothetical protein